MKVTLVSGATKRPVDVLCPGCNRTFTTSEEDLKRSKPARTIITGRDPDDKTCPHCGSRLKIGL